MKPDTKEHKKGVIYYKGGTKRKIFFNICLQLMMQSKQIRYLFEWCLYNYMITMNSIGDFWKSCVTQFFLSNQKLRMTLLEEHRNWTFKTIFSIFRFHKHAARVMKREGKQILGRKATNNPI